MPSLETSFFDRLSKNPDKIGVFAQPVKEVAERRLFW